MNKPVAQLKPPGAPVRPVAPKPGQGGAAPLTLATMPQRLKPSEVAAYLAVSTEHVMRFRDTGELEFINVGSPGAKTPSWRITREAVADFEAARKSE